MRQPTPRISNHCLALSKPRPYTALTGVSVAKGTADVFEGGPFTIAARVPGEGEAITKVKVLSGLVRFAGPVHAAPLPGPAEGVVAAGDVGQGRERDLPGQRPRLLHPRRVELRTDPALLLEPFQAVVDERVVAVERQHDAPGHEHQGGPEPALPEHHPEGDESGADHHEAERVVRGLGTLALLARERLEVPVAAAELGQVLGQPLEIAANGGSVRGGQTLVQTPRA